MTNGLIELFLELVDRSIAAGWLVLAVAALRLILRKAPRWLWPPLWGCVGLRLVCPFTVESALSLLPSAQTVSPELIYHAPPAIHSGVAAIDRVVNPVVGSFASSPGSSVNPLRLWLAIPALLWAAGAAGMLLWAAVSWARLRRRVSSAVRLEAGSYESEFVDTPFILGVLRPRIYLPAGLPEGDAELVLAHERAHLARRDHWTKPLGFLLLCVYWFNPVLWAAYALLCRDIELACDERVVRELSPQRRADYSQALLSCSAPRHIAAACPLAFGEVGVKERVKHVLNYKKPAFWLAGAAVVCCIAVAVCFLTDPPASPSDGGGAPLSGTAAPTAPSNPPEVPSPQVSAPAEAVPFDQEAADTAVASVLGSLRVGEDGALTFSMPDALPVFDGGATRMTVTLNAEGSRGRAELLTWARDWTPGQVYTAGPEALDGAERIFLRAAYMTDLGDGTYREVAANYAELTAPSFTTSISVVPAVELTQEGRALSAGFLLRDGTQFVLSLTLPEGLTAAAAEETSPEYAAPQVALLDADGNQAGVLSLLPLAADEDGLETVDTGADSLPMAVFATVALAAHADYEDYAVVRHGPTWASATARYVWQDLTGYAGRAPEAPWLGVDCVLAYDWSAAPCFAELTLGDGAYSPEILRSLAESVAFR